MKPSRGRARASTKPRSSLSRRAAANSQDESAQAANRSSSATGRGGASSSSSSSVASSSRQLRGLSNTNKRAANAARAANPRPKTSGLSVDESGTGGDTDGQAKKKFMATGPSGSPQVRYQQLKAKQEKERAEAIRSGLMHDPNKPRTLAEAITPVGTCPDMCPEFERVERIVQNDVWSAEADRTAPPNEQQSWKFTPDESRMVKKFRRAAAGIEEQLPSELRPPAVLKRTTDYLFNEVIGEADSLAQVHHFVWDRTRAIRNDFSIQQLTKVSDVKIAIDCYERIARFHILSLHQFGLEQRPYEQYADHQEREQLDKTLLSLLQYYDDNRNRLESPNELEFRAYYIIFQISGHTADVENRVQHWPRSMVQSSCIQIALQLYEAASNTFEDQGPLRPFETSQIASTNWFSWWAILEQEEVSYLTACMAEIQFAINRRNALWTIWQAYKPTIRAKIEDWTLSEFMDPLGFDNEDEVENFVTKFGFAVSERTDGQAFVDLSSRQDKQLPPLTVALRKQSKSSFVESKREGRTFPAVISGFSTQQAREAGLVESGTEDLSMTSDVEASDDDSLFFRPGAAEQKPKPKVKFNIPGDLNPSAPAWQPSTSDLFNSQKQTQVATENQPFAKIAQTNLGNTFAGTETATLGQEGALTSASISQSPFGTSIFPSNSQPSNPFTSSSTQSQPSNTPSKFPSSNSTPPTSKSEENQQTQHHTASNNPFIFQSQQPKAELGQQQSTSNTPQGSVSYPSLPAFSPRSTTESSLSSPLSQSNSSTSKPLFNFPSSSSSTPVPASASQIANNNPPTTSQTHKPQSSSPLAQPPLLREESATQDKGLQRPEPFNFNTNQQADATSVFSFPKQQSPGQAPATPLSQDINVTSSTQSTPSPATFAPTAKAPVPQESALQRHAEQEAERQAEVKLRKTQTMDRLSRVSLLEKSGLLDQYIENLTATLIRKTQYQMWFAKIDEEAYNHRLNHIKKKYFLKWRSIWWDHKVRREGKARRQRMKAAKEKRLEEERQRAKDNDFFAQMEALKQSQKEAARKEAEQRAAKHAAEQRTPKSPKAEDKARPSVEASSMPPPPRPEPSPSRRVVYNALGLSGPTTASPHRRSQSALSQSNSAKGPYANRPMRSSSLRNSYSPFSSSSSQPRVDSRVDKTNSIYFALKARGIDQIDQGLRKKRPRTSDPADALEAPPRKVTGAELDDSRMNGNALATSPSGAGTPSPARTRDEELFEASRKLREEMRESESFFRKEVERDSLARSVSSRATSPDNVSVASSTASKYRAQLEAALQDDPTETSRPSSRHSINTPPAYRNRVSKFVPREMYASVRMQQRHDFGSSTQGKARMSSASPCTSVDNITGSTSRIAERGQRYLAEEKDRLMRRSASSEIGTNGAELSFTGELLSDPNRPKQENSRSLLTVNHDDNGSKTSHLSAATLSAPTPRISEQKPISLRQATNKTFSPSNPQQKTQAPVPSSKIPSSNNPFAALGGDDEEEVTDTESENELDDGDIDMEEHKSDAFDDEQDEEDEESSEEGEKGSGFTMTAAQAREHFGGKAGTSADDAIEL